MTHLRPLSSFAVVLLLWLVLAGPALAERYWEGLGASNDGAFDIDIGSIKKINEAVLSVATRHVYAEAIATRQMQAFRLTTQPKYGVTEVLINCNRKVAATTDERIFDKNDRSLKVLHADRLEWQDINKGSIMEAVATAICCGESGKGSAAICAVSPGVSSTSGTGFIVSPEGHIVTNNHVVAGRKHIRTVIGGEKRNLLVVRADPANDLALLKMQATPPLSVAFREGELTRAGEPVVALGYPLLGVLANEPNVTTGTVSALSGPENDSRLLQFTAPVQQGNSGGPLLDACGNAIGMVAGKLDAMQLAKATGDIPQNVNFALQESMIVHFLRINGVEPQFAGCQQPLAPSDAAQKLRAAVVQIIAE